MILSKNLILSSRLTDKNFFKRVLIDNKLVKQSKRFIHFDGITDYKLIIDVKNQKRGNFPKLCINFY